MDHLRTQKSIFSPDRGFQDESYRQSGRLWLFSRYAVTQEQYEYQSCREGSDLSTIAKTRAKFAVASTIFVYTVKGNVDWKV